MKVKDILKDKGRQVVDVQPQATLYDALQALIENKVGALLVRSTAGMLAGIITERDIMREVHKNTVLREALVADVMTKKIDTASPEDKIEYLMNEMTEGRFRHVPIIDGDEIVGIVSIGDVVKAQLDHMKRQVSQLEDYIAEPRVE